MALISLLWVILYISCTFPSVPVYLLQFFVDGNILIFSSTWSHDLQECHIDDVGTDPSHLCCELSLHSACVCTLIIFIIGHLPCLSIIANAADISATIYLSSCCHSVTAVADDLLCLFSIFLTVSFSFLSTA